MQVDEHAAQIVFFPTCVAGCTARARELGTQAACLSSFRTAALPLNYYWPALAQRHNSPLCGCRWPVAAGAVGALLALAEQVDDKGTPAGARSAAQRELLFHLRVLEVRRLPA